MMPTGYTADVVSGKITTLREFVLQCARGMGATVMMRDAPWDAPIPERFEPSPYNAERLAEAEARLAAVDMLSPSEADERAAASFEEKHAEWVSRGERYEQERQRYDAMIALVEPYRGAPEGLKEFMLEQLRSGRDFDCNHSNRDKYDPEPVRKSGAEWRRDEAGEALRDIAYHRKAYAEEVARTEERNVWIAQLHRSLAAQAGETPHA